MKFTKVRGLPSQMSFRFMWAFTLMLAVQKVFSAPYTLKNTILDESNVSGPSKFDFKLNNLTADYSQGHVEDINIKDAINRGLLAQRNGSTYIGVDYDDTIPTDSSAGRTSVNLWSFVHLLEGLYIIDIQHAPTAPCALWSSLRIEAIDPTFSPESFAINANTDSWITAAGSPKCDISEKNTVAVPALDQGSMAATTNAQNGAVYAIEWLPTAVNVWLWFRPSVPPEITNNSTLDPTNWGKPNAQLLGDCHLDPNLKQELNIRIHSTFCPPWAREDYFRSECFPAAPVCTHFVASNPAAFEEAYWLINHIRIYDQVGKVSMNETDTEATIQPPD